MSRNILFTVASLIAMFFYMVGARELCGAVNPPAGLAETHRIMQQNERTKAYRKRSTFTVDLYIHSIERTTVAEVATDAMIQNQINVLQSSYAPFGISFNPKPVTRTVNDAWAAGTSDNAVDFQMRSALHAGGYNALNIYLLDTLPGQLIGDCTFPSGVGTEFLGTPEFGVADSILKGDGCRVMTGTVPGGTVTNYNLGMTAVHEVGHWFGLLHPFQGETCGGNGDFIDDTRNQSTPTFGCPATKNSCPEVALPGEDAIHNYMDYSDDGCLSSFTPLQAVRLQNIYQAYRAGTPNPTSSSSSSPSLSTSSSSMHYYNSTTTSLVSSTASATTTTAVLTTSANVLSSSAATTTLAATASATSSMTSAPPSSTAAALKDLFKISVQTSLSNAKRAAPLFISPSGFGVTDEKLATSFAILNGELVTPMGTKISTNPGVANAAFDSTAPLGSITTTFTNIAALSWSSPSFSNNPVIFCLTSQGQIMSVFSGSLPANCALVTLVPIPVSQLVSSSTSNVPSTTVIRLPVITGFVLSLSVSVYFDSRCNCMTTSTCTVAVPEPTPCTLTSTYYDSKCGCTTTSVYTTMSTPTAEPSIVGPQDVYAVATAPSAIATSTLPAKAGNASYVQIVQTGTGAAERPFALTSFILGSSILILIINGLA